jgi:hypothetical protein
MIHTRDDPIVPYVADSSHLFAQVQRLTFDEGSHLLFTPEQVAEVVDLV